jgi:hypothetical protein
MLCGRPYIPLVSTKLQKNIGRNAVELEAFSNTGYNGRHQFV